LGEGYLLKLSQYDDYLTVWVIYETIDDYHFITVVQNEAGIFCICFESCGLFKLVWWMYFKGLGIRKLIFLYNNIRAWITVMFEDKKI